VGSWRVRARNTSTISENKIHDDEVARSYGFAGGLVPGVDVYAYLTHVPVERWGRAFLERGAITARFLRPVYDGDDVVVEPVERGDALELSLFDSVGETCAVATASLPATPPTPPTVPPRVPTPPVRPRASTEAFAASPDLGAYECGFHAEHAPAYLDDVGETLPLYTDERIAHPGWLLRAANFVLSANVTLGPWIHVSSAVQHHGVVDDGDHLSTRARVVETFEKKGHEFVTLDVVTVANDMTPVLHVEHTAIFEPRRSG